MNIAVMIIFVADAKKQLEIEYIKVVDSTLFICYDYLVVTFSNQKQFSKLLLTFLSLRTIL